MAVHLMQFFSGNLPVIAYSLGESPRYHNEVSENECMTELGVSGKWHDCHEAVATPERELMPSEIPESITSSGRPHTGLRLLSRHRNVAVHLEAPAWVRADQYP